MFRIKKAHMSALEASEVQGFEVRTYAHLQRYFPRLCLLLGEERMCKVIQQGWQKSNNYQMTAECCVRSYIEFMCLLGSGFDSDPLLPWAEETLNDDKNTSNQTERCDRLYDRTWHYIDHIIRDYHDASGQPAAERLIGELHSLSRGRDNILALSGMPRFSHELASWIENVFPARCNYIGEAKVRDLIPRGIQTASRYGLSTERGVALFTVLMFVLGSGFTDDLLFPWVSATLNDKKIADQTQRTDRLYIEGVGFLQRWWASEPK